MTKRAWLGDALMALVSTVLMLVVAEVGVRFYVGNANVDSLPHAFADADLESRLRWLANDAVAANRDRYEFDVPDAELGWRSRPSVHARSTKPGSFDVMVTTDAEGLRRSTEAPAEEATRAPRIGVFGCSQTFGEGVEDGETYVAQLMDLEPTWHALNFGVHGYGTDQMLLQLEDERSRRDYDVIVLAFGWFHMRRNTSGFTFFAKPRFALDESGALRLTNVPVPSPEEVRRAGADRPLGSLADRSALLRWLGQRMANWREQRLYEDPAVWALSRALIVRFLEEAKATGAAVVLLNIDTQHPDLDPLLTEVARATGATFVNVADRLRVLEKENVDYRLPNDAHWNPAGHRAVAEALRDGLCASVLRDGCNARAAR